MNKAQICFFVVLVIVFFAAQNALACSCIPSLNEPLETQVKQAKQESEAVFTGKVLEIVENFDDGYIRVKIEVANWWKGNLSKEIIILSGSDDGNCRYAFEVNKTYLVYAYNRNMYSSEKILETTQCTRTADISDAIKDIKLLGKSKKPAILKSNKLL